MKVLVCPLFASLGAALVLLALIAGPADAGKWPEDCGNNKTHDFFFGGRSLYDRVLYTQQIVKQRSFLRKLSFDVQIPPYNQTSFGSISYVEVRDQNHDGSGGCAYLNRGGPGYNYVVLHIKSQRNKGVNFVVNLYGH